MNFDQFLIVLSFSIFYLLFSLYIRAIYPFDFLNLYIIEDTPENHFLVIGGLLAKKNLVII